MAVAVGRRCYIKIWKIECMTLAQREDIQSTEYIFSSSVRSFFSLSSKYVCILLVEELHTYPLLFIFVFTAYFSKLPSYSKIIIKILRIYSLWRIPSLLSYSFHGLTRFRSHSHINSPVVSNSDDRWQKNKSSAPQDCIIFTQFLLSLSLLPVGNQVGPIDNKLYSVFVVSVVTEVRTLTVADTIAPALRSEAKEEKRFFFAPCFA